MAHRDATLLAAHWIYSASAYADLFQCSGNRLNLTRPNYSPNHLHVGLLFILHSPQKFSPFDRQLPHENFFFLPAVFRIENRNDDHVENRGSEQSAEDYVRHWTLQFFPGDIANQQRKESQRSRGSSHKNR